MNIVFGGAVRYFTGINIRYSPCGRELGFMGQLASLQRQSPILKEVVEIALSIFFGSTILMSMGISDLILKYQVTTNFSNLTSYLVNELFFLTLRILPIIIGVWALASFFKEEELQREERDLVNDLGGRFVFVQLPEVDDIENEKDLRHLEPSDVRHQPITRGCLADGRFFLALQVQEKQPHQQQPVMTVLCQTDSLLPWRKRWTVLGHQKKVLGRGWFHLQSLNLRRLLRRVHPTHELV